MSQIDAKRRSKAKKVPTEIITEEEIQRKIDDGFKLIEIEKRKLNWRWKEEETEIS